MSDHEGTSAVNLGLASSLLSRFDLVLILRDERNREWDTRVANHIFYETKPKLGENLYDLAKLQAHFSAVRDFDPILTDGATRILKAYYLACRSDEHRDAGRTTIRFNDSLYRLAKAHAKLLFRNEVTEVDAVLVVMLTESSFGFGRILEPTNILHKDLPLGPSDEQIIDLMGRLHLEWETPVKDAHSNAVTANLQLRVDERTANKENETINRRSEVDGSDDRQNRFEGNNVQGSDAHSEETLNPRMFTVRKRQFNRSMSNENITIVPARHTQCPKNQLANGTCPTGANPSTHPWKRFRMDLNDEELDQLFSLDEPIATETNTVDSVSNDVQVPATNRIFGNSSNDDDELDRVFTLDESTPISEVNAVANSNVPASVRILNRSSNEDDLDELFTLDEPTTTTEMNRVSGITNINVDVPASLATPILETAPNTQQNQEVEQQPRFRFFNNCTDEDLAALDDLDF